MINANEYAELHTHSFFSLLDGVSSPEALVAYAHDLGLRSLALTDHNSLAGAIRFWKAAQRPSASPEEALHPIFGAEVDLENDRHHLTLLAENQQGYASLCRLLTAAHLGNNGHPERPVVTLSARPDFGRVSEGSHSAAGAKSDKELWPGKGTPAVTWELLDAHHRGLIALTGCRRGPVAAALRERQPEQATAAAAQLRDIFGRDHVWVELQHHYLPDDDRLVRALLRVSHSLDLPCIATNNVHYTLRSGSRLRDALIAIDRNLSLTEARRAGFLPSNSNYYLASPDEMARRFAELPDALRNTLAIAERCNVSLDFSQRRLPPFPCHLPPSGTGEEGVTEFTYLYQLGHAGLPGRYPDLKPAVLKQLAHELAVIEQAGLAGYFLIVWDIVRFAREQGIRCQGRGSAANSIVAYLLGITAVDPLAHNLLFERFLSADRFTTPDIDIDFAADRREEVIQYVYEKYGAEHTAMVCNVVTFQARSAVRDLGKALDFPLPVVERQRGDQHPADVNGEVARAVLDLPHQVSEHADGVVARGVRSRRLSRRDALA